MVFKDMQIPGMEVTVLAAEVSIDGTVKDSAIDEGINNELYEGHARIIRRCSAAGMRTGTVARAADAEPQAVVVDDVIARVGDQTITFSEINTALNSSAIVGVSIPALGTPERDTARIVLLDRFVSANLLYLDAIKQGVDQDPGYQKDVTRFSNAILAGLYRQRIRRATFR